MHAPPAQRNCNGAASMLPNTRRRPVFGRGWARRGMRRHMYLSRPQDKLVAALLSEVTVTGHGIATSASWALAWAGQGAWGTTTGKKNARTRKRDDDGDPTSVRWGHTPRAHAHTRTCRR
eukprot:scaffold8225_cov129-Isochrysis_galbana.AAC.9